MRRVLFVHNGPLLKGDDGKIYGVHYTNQIVERYRQLGDHITFLMRGRNIASANGTPMEITAKDFDFVEVDDIVSPISKFWNLTKVRGIIQDEVEKCSLVVARVPSAVASETIRVARVLRKPYLIECVACSRDVLWNYNWKGKIAASWYARKQRELILTAPFVLYVTGSFLQKRYPSRGLTVGISDVAIGELTNQDLTDRLNFIEGLRKSNRPLRLVTIADLNVPYKSQSDVIRAIGKLKQEGITCHYHLIGGGSPSRLLPVIKKAGVESQIIVHGTVPHAAIFAKLREMDIYVHPSRTEGLPRALVESFSVALPAIGSRVGGIPELLEPERLFTPGSIDEIVRLIKLLNSPHVLRKDAIRNWKHARNFEFELLNEQRKAFFSTFLEQYNMVKTPSGS